MPIAHYLAMTGAEMAGNPNYPLHTAWMACHFSSGGKGLSNLPKWLPPASMLILDDSTPIGDHDPALIARQLEECLEKQQFTVLLLDFQRSGDDRTQALTDSLCSALSCQVAVSEYYAADLDCGIFLSPIAPDETVASRLSRWTGRPIWLDTTKEGLEITLCENGATRSPSPVFLPPDCGFSDHRLHCHYQISLGNDKANFTLWRTEEDLSALLTEAESLGVAGAVGLYQEFKSPLPESEEGEA